MPNVLVLHCCMSECLYNSGRRCGFIGSIHSASTSWIQPPGFRASCWLRRTSGQTDSGRPQISRRWWITSKWSCQPQVGENTPWYRVVVTRAQTFLGGREMNQCLRHAAPNLDLDVDFSNRAAKYPECRRGTWHYRQLLQSQGRTLPLSAARWKIDCWLSPTKRKVDWENIVGRQTIGTAAIKDTKVLSLRR